jgi:hypothetical protein
MAFSPQVTRMSQKLLSAILFVAAASTLSATTFTFNTVSSTLGDDNKFKIQSVTFNTGATSSSPWSVIIDMNYNLGDRTLSDFTVIDTLSPSDLFFTIGGSVGYGIATKNHTNSPNVSSAYHTGGSLVQAGTLYKINAGGLLTAMDVLADTQYLSSYRPGYDVWMWNNGSGSIQQAGAGSINSITNPSGPLVEISMQFTPDSTLRNALSSGQLGFLYSNATCANSTIGGNFAVPEPTSLLLSGAGLLLLAGILGRRRKAVRS